MKKLESQLQDLEDFDSPKVELEQYATPPHIAAYILNYVSSHYKDIQNKVVADLGCGTGRLSLGSILLGASHVIGFDIDSEALSAAQNNVLRLFGDEQSDNESDSCDGPRICRVCPQINFVQADLNSDESGSFFSKMDKMFDTVIMNPPFGTKGSLGIDVKFLELAVKLANCSVYSLHKSSTRNVSFLSVKF